MPRFVRRLFQSLDALRARARVRTDGVLRALPPALAVLAAVALAWRHLLKVEGAGLEALLLVEVAIVGAFVLRVACLLVLGARTRAVLRERPVEHLVALAAVLALAWCESRGRGPLVLEPVWRLASGAVKAYLIAAQAFEAWRAGIAWLRLSPPFVLLLTFVTLIGAGTALLLDPRATPRDQPIGAVDALFTATSAACVTGLTVRDTGTGFTAFGHQVILGLIQVGGLGIMTFAAFFASLFGRGLGIRDRVLIRDMLQAEEVSGLPRVLAFLCLSTLAIEAAGAAALYALDGSGRHPDRAFAAAFHAVSAFCNAGFGLYPDSLGGFDRDISVLAVFGALIVLGGLGFPVVFDLWRWALRGLLRAIGRGGRRRPEPFALQTRLALIVSAALVLGGAALLVLYEGERGVYGHLAPADRWANAAFLSISCRTAGFNVAPTGAFGAGAVLTMVALMFIGGSPGSTAGGVKTTTIGVLTARVMGLLRHREEIELFRRTVPRRTIASAIGVVFIQFGFIYALTLALMVTDGRFGLEGVLFEVVSAVSTVGLSTGVTPEVSTAGRLLLSFGMLAGRLGALTLILAMAERSGTQPNYRYPDAKVMIG